MSRAVSRRSRPASARELKELYGMSVHQIRSSEEVFRKESYKRDKQLLHMKMEAINAEKKHAERKWYISKSRFERQHAPTVHGPNGKRRVEYRKVATVEAQPEEAIPPCIPFVGAFPPTRHPTKARRLADMFKEPLFSRGGEVHELDDLGYDDTLECGEKDGGGVGDDNYTYFLANHRVSKSYGTPGAASGRPSVFGGGAGRVHVPLPRSGNSSVFSPRVANRKVVEKSAVSSSAQPSRFSHTSGKHPQRMASNQANRNESTSARLNNVVNGQRGGDAGSDTNNNCVDGHNRKAEYQKGFDGRGHFVTDPQSWTTNSHGKLTYRNATDHRPRMSKTFLSQAVNQSKQNAQLTVASMESRTGKTAMHQNTKEDTPRRPEQDYQDRSGRNSPSRLSDRTSSTPDSLDVDLLQQALVDHSKQNLSRSRWQKAAERVLLRSHGIHEDETPSSLRDAADNFHESMLSLSSVSTPSTRSATDLSEMPQDGSMRVVQIIMQLFRELDQPHLETANLADAWPGKMEKMMAAIEELVRHTGVEVTEIVEKIQRGDIHDEKSAALLDWINNIDNAPATTPNIAQDEGELSSDIEEDNARVITNSANGSNRGLNLNVSAAEHCNTEKARSRRSTLSSSAASSHRLSITPQTVWKAPVISIVPPRRHQSGAEDADDKRNDDESLAGTDVHLLNAVSRNAHAAKPGNAAGDKQTSPLPDSSYSPCTSNDAARLYLRRRASLASSSRRSSSESHSSNRSFPKRLSSSSQSSNELGHDDVFEERPSPIPRDIPPHQHTHHCSSGPMANNTRARREPSQKDEERVFLPSMERSVPHIYVSEDQQPLEESIQFSSRLLHGPAGSAGKLYDFPSVVLEAMTSRKDKLSSNEDFRASSARKVSFDTSRVSSVSSLSSEDTSEIKRRSVQNYASDISRSSSFSRSVRNGSHVAIRPRVNSTGQQVATRRERQMMRKTPGQTTRGRSLSPSPSFPSPRVAVEDVATPREDQQEITTSVMHTDRRGKTHRLTMRKVSLSHTPLREANVIVTREEDAPEQDLAQDDDTDENPCSPNTPRNDQASIHTTEKATDKRGKAQAGEHTILTQTNHTREDTPAAETQPETEEAEASTDDDENLWRKRLAHHRHHDMSWVPELSADHKAQGLALSLLLRKEGGGPRFRSMALKVICINALRAAKNVYEDSTYTELKRCRYLRMPKDYTPETQLELSVSEIFS